MDSRVIPSTEDIEMTVFLTVVAENIHAVSHMKHETFSMYEYAKDFGKIFKEATKRSAKCGHHYFTHPTSYYPLLKESLTLAEVPKSSLCLPNPLPEQKEER